MEKTDRLFAENMALSLALKTLLAGIDPASEAKTRSMLRTARDTAEALLLAKPLSDEQAELVRSSLDRLAKDLGRALPLSNP